LTEIRFSPAGDRPSLVIEDAAAFASAVFKFTQKTLVRLDQRVGVRPRDRIVRDDIDAMNSVMSTPTSAEALLARAERVTERLRMLDESWSTTEMSETDWNRPAGDREHRGGDPRVRDTRSSGR
jgi:predicted ATP-grasp superfamily ATP-dependent carboligase